MRKHLGLGVSLLASVALVAACGGGSGSDETTEPTAQVSEDAGGAAAGAELVVWSDAERAEAIENAATQFEEDTGATVTVVQKNFEDLRADFLAQV
ncbi:MAG TPA: maltose ABC transporter substrate-binding protein, partial [Ruania sp.]|nr:maltose ABC transporter substrate-binding protein [Ruania sp.]